MVFSDILENYFLTEPIDPIPHLPHGKIATSFLQEPVSNISLYSISHPVHSRHHTFFADASAMTKPLFDDGIPKNNSPPSSEDMMAVSKASKTKNGDTKTATNDGGTETATNDGDTKTADLPEGRQKIEKDDMEPPDLQAIMENANSGDAAETFRKYKNGAENLKLTDKDIRLLKTAVLQYLIKQGFEDMLGLKSVYSKMAGKDVPWRSPNWWVDNTARWSRKAAMESVAADQFAKEAMVEAKSLTEMIKDIQVQVEYLQNGAFAFCTPTEWKKNASSWRQVFAGLKKDTDSMPEVLADVTEAKNQAMGELGKNMPDVNKLKGNAFGGLF